jgi:hypothetical protein
VFNVSSCNIIADGGLTTYSLFYKKTEVYDSVHGREKNAYTVLVGKAVGQYHF